MSKRFERMSAKLEAIVIGAVLLVVAIAYIVSRFMDVSLN
jgi:hypothetical protein